MNVEQLLRDHNQAFDNLSDEALTDLILSARDIHVPKGSTIDSVDPGNERLYVVLAGQVAAVEATKSGEERILSRLVAGQVLSGIGQAAGSASPTAYRAIEDSRLLAIPRESCVRLTTRRQASPGPLEEAPHDQTTRLLVSKYIETLFSTTNLAISDPQARHAADKEWEDFEHTVLESLKETVEWRILSRGQYLFRQGDEADGAFILVSGVLGVTLSSDGGTEREIDRVTHGGIVGEMALVADEKRSANIVALRDCELFKLPSAAFQHIAERYPRIMRNVYRTISERFIHSRATRTYRQRTSNLSFFTWSPNPSVARFLEGFYGHLSSSDKIKLLTRHSVENELGTEGIANLARDSREHIPLMHWLNDQELEARFVIYRADEEWSEWSRRCVSQADRIVIFSDVGDTTDFSEFTQTVGATGQNWHLVLIHPPNTDRPRNTSRWLERSGAARVYHVRQDHAGDLERLTRILTGRAFGLVLGGGGARGFAHIGVLRALDELGVKVDMIGGASIGAPIAGWMAQGVKPTEIRSRAKRIFGRLIDYTLPLTSLIRGKRISRAIQEETGDWNIEDYWLPFFCVSTNLTRATQVVHSSGNSARACRASISIPGVLPPVPEGRDLLVDGGVMNNLPINVMRDMNPSGTVMAIDVLPPTGSTSKEDYGLELSGWHQLIRSISPFKKPIRAPKIGAVIMQSMVLGSSVAREQALKQGLADYYQNLHINNVGIMEFNKLDYAEKRGYELALPKIKEWLESNQPRP